MLIFNLFNYCLAVWSGEAAAARREAREESRKRSILAEQLTRTTAVASRTQDRLDTLTVHFFATSSLYYLIIYVFGILYNLFIGRN